jgi:hypothetical protein
MGKRLDALIGKENKKTIEVDIEPIYVKKMDIERLRNRQKRVYNFGKKMIKQKTGREAEFEI